MVKKKNLYKTLTFTTEYFEYFALEILKQFNCDKYQNLCFVGKSEFPDLQSADGKKIGVEVTRAVSPIEAKCDSLNATYGGCHKDDIPQKIKEIVCQGDRGWSFDENGIAHALLNNRYEDNQYDVLVSSLKKKVDTINKPHAKHFDVQELFVFLTDILSNESIKHAYAELLQYQSRKEFQYQALYILTSNRQNNCLYLCKDQDSISSHSISTFIEICREKAYVNSGMKDKSLKLLIEQGHIIL